MAGGGSILCHSGIGDRVRQRGGRGRDRGTILADASDRMRVDAPKQVRV
jgi:hypothetical protein